MNLNEYLKKNPIIYIAKDPDKGLGFSEGMPNFFVMCPKDKITPDLRGKFGKIFIPSKIAGSTRAILADEQNLTKIKSLGASILVFKNTPSIAKIARNNKIKILNNPPELSSKIEEKISQFNWLQDLKKYLPENSEIKLTKDIVWKNNPIILQWNTAHSGDGTILIETKNDLNNLKEKFPDREGRISEKIDGLTFTNNNVVFENKIKTGNLSFQITGLLPFTTNKFSTIGNDFNLPNKLLSAKNTKAYKKIAEKIGLKLQKENYRGIFGLDMIFEPKTEKWFLIEINARQTSSTNLESWLQTQNEDVIEKTIFGNHLSALLQISNTEPLTKIETGSQIIIRKQIKQTLNIPKIKTDLNSLIDFVFVYDNEKENEELIRIYTDKNILKTFDKFNDLGKKIIEVIKKNAH